MASRIMDYEGKITMEDRLEMAKYLLKAGYTVTLDKVKPEGSKRNINFIQYERVDKEDIE